MSETSCLFVWTACLSCVGCGVVLPPDFFFWVGPTAESGKKQEKEEAVISGKRIIPLFLSLPFSCFHTHKHTNK